MSATAVTETRDRFRWWLEIPTRWMDNDVYGHVNNVQYYSYFDTAVNSHLIREAGLDIHNSPVIGLVVETRCQFKKSLVFPDVVEAGIRVEKIGRSSVAYNVGLFRAGDDEIAALGHFVHVYVERESQTPVPIPDRMRAAMEPLRLDP
ncbi:acyl-CoA thioesterase [Nisaea sediminum]|uniref:acyl-CoA thioesterase n=1 Tax=Nisaea sediminum TaxID=2775867 RepID=UPI0029C01C7A|nr:thioesterase family protein [Nisaea sediminum]